jgi:cytochrome P450
LSSKAAREHTLYPFFVEALKKSGNPNNPHTMEASVAGQRAIVTDDPDNLKAILATQFKDFGKGEPFHQDWKEFLGDSIFATDGQLWHNSRQLIRPQFIKDRVSDLDTFERHLVVLLRELAATPDGIGRGKEVDVTELFFRYTLDAATDFLLGRSVGSLENRDDRFAKAFGEVQRIQTAITRLG